MVKILTIMSDRKEESPTILLSQLMSDLPKTTKNDVPTTAFAFASDQDTGFFRPDLQTPNRKVYLSSDEDSDEHLPPLEKDSESEKEVKLEDRIINLENDVEQLNHINTELIETQNGLKTRLDELILESRKTETKIYSRISKLLGVMSVCSAAVFLYFRRV